MIFLALPVPTVYLPIAPAYKELQARMRAYMHGGSWYVSLSLEPTPPSQCREHRKREKSQLRKVERRF